LHRVHARVMKGRQTTKMDAEGKRGKKGPRTPCNRGDEPRKLTSPNGGWGKRIYSRSMSGKSPFKTKKIRGGNRRKSGGATRCFNRMQSWTRGLFLRDSGNRREKKGQVGGPSPHSSLKGDADMKFWEYEKEGVICDGTHGGRGDCHREEAQVRLSQEVSREGVEKLYLVSQGE